jgi:N-acetylmuramoyl-L-alanine amidase
MKRISVAAVVVVWAALPAFAQNGAAAPPSTSAAQAAALPSKAGAANKATAAVEPAVPPPPTGPLNRLVIVVDPAHGGIDNGSRIGDATLEKNVTLDLGLKLRSLLAARGFTVVMTRDSDDPGEAGPAAAALTLDDRAGIANHARAVACLSLHATGAGQGVHLYSSELTPAAGEATVLPWLAAQAAWVPESRGLERSLGDALTRAGIALVLSAASVRPVDSLTCPALVVELAPENGDPASVSDPDYQQRVAQAIAATMLFWSKQAQPPVRLAAANANNSGAASSAGAAAAATSGGAQP